MKTSDLELLSELIQLEIQKEFKFGPLCDTIRTEVKNGEVVIHIPAPEYDTTKYKKTGVVVYKNNGKSYADALNKSGKHKDFVQRAINNAINIWLGINQIDAEVKKWQ